MRLTGIGSQYLFAFGGCEQEVLRRRQDLQGDAAQGHSGSELLVVHAVRQHDALDARHAAALSARGQPELSVARRRSRAPTAPRPSTSVRRSRPGVKRGNWIQTMPGKGWFVILRLYSPLEPFFDKILAAERNRAGAVELRWRRCRRWRSSQSERRSRPGYLSQPVGENHRAAGARRRRGPGGAHHRRQAARRHGPGLRGREPGGRRRRDRDADDRARAAGRLHADDRLRGHARHQPRGETQSRLRRRQGFHAHRHARRHAQRAGRGARGAGQHAAGIRRLRQGQSAQGRLRHLGRRARSTTC